MADVNYAAFSFIAKPAIIIAKSRSNCLIPRASHAPSPLKLAKPRRRRNSLRPKILTKPYSPPELNPSLAPIAPLEAPLTERNDESVSVVSVENDRTAEELVLGGASGRSLAVRYGIYLIGAFIFQTVLAVWILGNGSSDEKDEVLDGLDSDRRASLVNGNGLGSNVIHLGEKIDEIRAMARQAKRDEKSENVGDESLSSRSRIGIEREIGNRLKKVQKRLNSDKEKFPGLYTRHLSKLGASLEAKKGNENLVFRKKLRFRSSPAKLGESPKAKGFGGFEKNKASRGSAVGDKAMALPEGENEDIRKSQNGWNESKGNGTRRDNDGNEAGPVRKSGNGVIQESRHGRPSTESAHSETSKASRREKDQAPVEDNREAVEESCERSVLNGNGSLRHNEAIKKPASSELFDKQSSVGTDMWWLNLPYVLVVVIHQESDPEGVAGFYTLKPDTEAKDQAEYSYTVAFEDRGDANNFCFILECFFEELGDVRADIIPMSVNELEAAVNSGKWQVIVVRKGQLQLYAGQPFEEVEMALHKLVEEAKSD